MLVDMIDDAALVTVVGVKLRVPPRLTVFAPSFIARDDKVPISDLCTNKNDREL
jgi:hypothetical protein